MAIAWWRSILHWCASLCTMASWLGTRDRKTAFLYKVVVVHPSKFLNWNGLYAFLSERNGDGLIFLYYNWFHQQSERMPCPYSIKKGVMFELVRLVCSSWPGTMRHIICWTIRLKFCRKPVAALLSSGQTNHMLLKTKRQDFQRYSYSVRTISYSISLLISNLLTI